jgi:uncharacterized LabA/DUF88 family protein
MNDTTYLFVDAGHLRQHYAEFALLWFGSEANADLRAVKQGLGAIKCFYYDCINDLKGDNESQVDLEARVALAEAEVERIRAIEGTHVRLGSITGKKRRQKKVDVQIAVDMLTHAIRRNMGRTILLSGDHDFVPLVEELVNMGLYVTVVGDRKHTSKALAHAADGYMPITPSMYYQWSPDLLKRQTPMPGRFYRSPKQVEQEGGWRLFKQGTVGGLLAQVYERSGEYLLIRDEEHGVLHVNFKGDPKRLEYFCELEFGEASLG